MAAALGIPDKPLLSRPAWGQLLDQAERRGPPDARRLGCSGQVAGHATPRRTVGMGSETVSPLLALDDRQA